MFTTKLWTLLILLFASISQIYATPIVSPRNGPTIVLKNQDYYPPKGETMIPWGYVGTIQGYKPTDAELPELAIKAFAIMKEMQTQKGKAFTTPTVMTALYIIDKGVVFHSSLRGVKPGESDRPPFIAGLLEAPFPHKNQGSCGEFACVATAMSVLKIDPRGQKFDEKEARATAVKGQKAKMAAANANEHIPPCKGYYCTEKSQYLSGCQEYMNQDAWNIGWI